MGIGYSVRLTQHNKDADPQRIGVRLGRACIDKNVSVIEAARVLRVSRQTLYNWFSGKAVPLARFVPAVEAYLHVLG